MAKNSYSSFLAAFNYEKITLAVNKDNEFETTGKTAGKYIWNGKVGSSVRAFKPVIDTMIPGPLLADLEKLNTVESGMAVWFMVNGGDGVVHETHKTCRSKDSVQTLKALYIDTDKGDIEVLREFLELREIYFHFVVQTSPGKYHCYLLINDTPLNKESRDMWLACQNILLSVDPRYDRSVTDYSRVLRVPGFLHLKKEVPFTVEVVEENPHEKYELDFLYGVLAPTDILKASKNGNGAHHVIEDDKLSSALQTKTTLTTTSTEHTGEKYTYPETKLGEGEMYPDMKRYVMSVCNKLKYPFPFEVEKLVLENCYYHAIAYYSKETRSSYLKGGNRHTHLEKLVSDCLTKIHHEQAIQNKNLKLTDEREYKDKLSSSVEVDENEIENEENDSVLPDDFFLSAPGITGEIVRDLQGMTANPYPSFAFASAISLLGILKAGLVKAEFNGYEISPTTYFFCSAASGRGKNFYTNTIINSLERIGAGNICTSSIRSKQGIYKRIQEQEHHKQLICHDEAHYFFNTLRDKNCPPYIKDVKPFLLSIYSAHERDGFDPGEIISTGNKNSILKKIKNAYLGYIGFGTLLGKDQLFSDDSIESGILNRFLVFKDVRKLQVSSVVNKLDKYPFLNKLKDMVEKYKAFFITKNLDGDDLGVVEGDIEVNKECKFSKVNIPFSDGAYNLLVEYDRENIALRNKLKGLRETIVARNTEQVLRISLALADDRIDKKCIEFAIKLVDFQSAQAIGNYKRIEKKVLDEVVQFDDNKLLNKIKKLQIENDGKPVLKRQITVGCRKTNLINQNLEALVSAGVLAKHDKYRAEGVTAGRTAIAYSLVLD